MRLGNKGKGYSNKIINTTFIGQSNIIKDAKNKKNKKPIKANRIKKINDDEDYYRMNFNYDEDYNVKTQNKKINNRSIKTENNTSINNRKNKIKDQEIYINSNKVKNDNNKKNYNSINKNINRKMNSNNNVKKTSKNIKHNISVKEIFAKKVEKMLLEEKKQKKSKKNYNKNTNNGRVINENKKAKNVNNLKNDLFNTKKSTKTNKKLSEQEVKKRKKIKKLKKNLANKNAGLKKNIRHTIFNIKDNIKKEKNEVIFNEEDYLNSIKTKKFKIVFAIVILIFIALIVRVAWLQFVDGKSLKEKADRQQTINKIISPKRGNIYDKNGVALALSASVDTVTINPKKIKDSSGDSKKTELLKQKVAEGLSEIFELNYDEVYEKVNSNNSIETIAKKVEQDKIEKLKNWMSENKISLGINIDEDNKRYYPYSTLAANLIGFTGTDNSGLEGIEAEWNSVLAGTSGKIVTSKDINDSEISSDNEQYVQAENGSDLILSIDVNVQTIVEKVIAQYVNENQCDSGCGIIMNPKTGDILAMANYPTYDLNNPFTPNSKLAKTWDGLSETARYNALLKMWRNKAVSDTYEPGSTFKVIVSAIALEENLVTTDKAGDFNCKGSEIIGDKEIHCWKTTAHGYESLREALENSCNPAFMQLGKRVGVKTLYKYFKAFGLFDKTGIDTSGEASSVFFDEDKVGPTELATMSFGQRFNITPIQLITAVSSIANDGKLVKPRVVKQVVGKDTTTNIDTVEVRQVVSEETASKVRSMMESVVTNGTGKYGSVKGYSIGGKTGTSEPSAGKENEGYIVSYVAIAPVENPELVALVVFYNPGGNNPEGGKLAGPAMSQILTEVLPYLGISNDSTNNATTSSITVPDVTNKTIAEAKKVLENIGLTVKLGNVEDQNTELVTEQTPKAGTSLLRNGIIKLYGNDNTRTSVNIPNVKGKTLAQARNEFMSKNLNIDYEGTGVVITQTPSYTTSVDEGTVIKVVLADELKEAH